MDIKYNMPDIFTTRTISVYEPAHEISVLIVWGVTKAKASLHSCLHVQRTDIDKVSNQNLDLKTVWISQHGRLLKAFPHMR